MFCPHCNATLPDDATFCSVCGNQVQNQQAQPELDLQKLSCLDAQQPSAGHISAKLRGLTKSEFLSKEANEKTRNMATFSIGASVLAVVLIIVSAFISLNTAVYKLPIISTVLGIDNENAIEEIEERLEVDPEIFDEARDILEEYKDDINNDAYEKIEDFINKTESLAENPSLSNITDIISQAEKLTELDVDSKLESKLDFDSLDYLETVAGLFNGIKLAICIANAIFVLLVVLAFFKKSTGLAIFVAIISIPIILALSGLVWNLLIFATLIAMAVAFSRINKAYKS